MASQQGYVAGNPVNAVAFQTAFATIATMTGVPLVGNPEGIAQRLEELTGIVGSIAEGLAHTAPAVNQATANNEFLAVSLANLEGQINTVKVKVDWTEAQRIASETRGSEGSTGNGWTPRAACESKAMMIIRP